MRRYGKTGGNGARFDVGEKGRWRKDKEKKKKAMRFSFCAIPFPSVFSSCR